MTKILSSTFIRTDSEGKEICPHFEFTINVSGIPDAMKDNGSTEGFYAKQIKFRYMEFNAVPRDEPHALIVDVFCGGVNPGYRDALVTLFGLEIGSILDMTSDVYMDAMLDHWELFDGDEAGYIGTLGVIDQLLFDRQSDELAEQVYRRLMSESLFV